MNAQFPGTRNSVPHRVGAAVRMTGAAAHTRCESDERYQLVLPTGPGERRGSGGGASGFGSPGASP